MVYKNKGGQSRENTMIAAYSLVKDFGANQENVANVLDCSQGTISNWIKEVEHVKERTGLKDELARAHECIEELREELSKTHLLQAPQRQDDIEEECEAAECEYCSAPATHLELDDPLCDDCFQNYADGFSRD